MPILSGVGASQSVNSASGGKVFAYNNISNAAAIVVAQRNPSRVSITFHNPGTADIFIAPSNVQNVIGTAPTNLSNNPLTLSLAALGGSFRVFGNGGALTVSGECQNAWQALAASGTTNALTVMESNI